MNRTKNSLEKCLCLAFMNFELCDDHCDDRCMCRFEYDDALGTMRRKLNTMQDSSTIDSKP